MSDTDASDTEAAVSDTASDGEEPLAGWSDEDDRTTETLRWLRARRQGHRRQKSRDIGLLVYGVLVALVGYGSGYVFHFVRQLRLGADYSDVGDALLRGLPAGCVALTLALALLAARDALWRGPLMPPGPYASWVLTQPVRRAQVLRPWFWLTAGLVVLPALLGGVVAALTLRITGLASFGAAVAGCLPAVLCLPLLAVAFGMTVEARPRLTAWVRRCTPPAALLIGLLVAQFVGALVDTRFPVLERVELWSGPWGWAAQPALAVAGGSVPGWPAAVLLLVALTAGGMVAAHRDVVRVSNSRLRARGATTAAVGSVLWTVELRAAKLAISEASGATATRRRVRPPKPPTRGGRQLVVVWRDVAALLRMPALVPTSLLWACGAVGVLWLGDALGGDARTGGLICALIAGYRAVGTLAEPARMETDDLRRSSWSPFRFSSLMLRHAALPILLGTLLGLLAAVPFALAGAGWTLLVMPLCAVPFAAAAVFGACRGAARTTLLVTGMNTPFGDPGPVLFLAWYLVAPVASIVGLTLVLHPAMAGGLTADALPRVVVTCAVLTGGLLFLAGRCAGRLRRQGG